MIGQITFNVCSPAGPIRTNRLPLGTSRCSQPPFDLADWQVELAEFGLTDIVRRGLVSFNETAEHRRAAFERGLNLAELLRDGLNHPML